MSCKVMNLSTLLPGHELIDADQDPNSVTTISTTF